MPIIDLFVQLTITLSVTNTLLSFFFYKKHRNELSRFFFHLVLIGFSNTFFLGMALYLLEAYFPEVTGYEYLYLIGLMITIITIIVMIHALRNLFFLGVGQSGRSSSALSPVFLTSVMVMLLLGIFVREINLLFKILWLMLLGTGLLHLVNYTDMLIRFIRKYSDIPSYAARKAMLAIFIVAGIYIPVQYIILTSFFIHLGWDTSLLSFIQGWISNNNISIEIRKNFPLVYHFFFHLISIIIIAKYYFQASHPRELIIPTEIAIQLDYSRRELEIALLILQGLDNKSIREHLFIADGTLRNHISSIYTKTRISSRAEFIMYFKKLNESSRLSGLSTKA